MKGREGGRGGGRKERGHGGSDADRCAGRQLAVEPGDLGPVLSASATDANRCVSGNLLRLRPAVPPTPPRLSLLRSVRGLVALRPFIALLLLCSLHTLPPSPPPRPPKTNNQLSISTPLPHALLQAPPHFTLLRYVSGWRMAVGTKPGGSWKRFTSWHAAVPPTSPPLKSPAVPAATPALTPNCELE